MFREDLLTQPRKLSAKGDREIAMMDANENVNNEAMCKQFEKNGLNIREVIYSQTNVRGPKTDFKGIADINGIWMIEELDVRIAAYLSFDPELGDHQPMVVNKSKKSLLGVNGPKVNLITSRRLNFKVKQIRQK